MLCQGGPLGGGDISAGVLKDEDELVTRQGRRGQVYSGRDSGLRTVSSRAAGQGGASVWQQTPEGAASHRTR